MLQRALENVSKDLHVAMSVTGKPATSLDHVFINHPQAAKTHVRRIIVIAKRECVIGIEPAEIEMATLLCFANFDHQYSSALSDTLYSVAVRSIRLEVGTAHRCGADETLRVDSYA